MIHHPRAVPENARVLARALPGSARVPRIRRGNLDHPDRAVRVAALDAFLLDDRPHRRDPAARAVALPTVDTLARSRALARSRTW